MRNELDHWLRQHADPGTDQPAPDGWDTPSEAVWAGVRAGLDQRRKRRRRFLFWLFLLAGLAGTGLWWSKSPQNPAALLASPIAATATSAGPSRPTLPARKDRENYSPAPSLVGTTAPASAAATADRSPARTTEPESPANNASFNQNTQTPALHSEKQNPQPETQNTQHETRTPQPETQNTKHETRNPQPETQNTQPETRNPQPETQNTQHETRTPQPETQNTQPEIRNPQPETRTPQPETQNTKHETRNTKHETRTPQHETRNTKHETRCYAAAAAGLRYTSRSLQGPGNALPKGRESGAWVREVGLRAGWQIQPHWAIETGLYRSAIRLKAERTLNFRYRTSTEQFDNQNFAYRNSAEESLETSFGKVDMRMDLSREPNRPIADQAAVALVLHTDEQVNYWSLPLLLRYVQPGSRWQWSLSAGIGLSLEAGYQAQVQAARANRPGIRNIRVRLQSRASGLSALLWDARLGAGLQYRLSERASIALNPEFRYGLSSIYRRGPFRSLPYSGGIDAGFYWKF